RTARARYSRGTRQRGRRLLYGRSRGETGGKSGHRYADQHGRLRDAPQGKSHRLRDQRAFGPSQRGRAIGIWHDLCFSFFMTDGINRTPPIRPPNDLGRSASIDRNKNPEQTAHPGVDADAPQKRTEEDFHEELMLTVATARLIVRGEVPPEARAALEAFAPLGDLNGAEILCDILEKRQQD